MASTGMDKLGAELVEAMKLGTERGWHLNSMPEGFEKAWIKDLIADNERLKARNNTLAKRLGADAFSPVIDE